MEAYLKGQNLLNKFAAWAEKKGLKRRNNLMMKSRRLFEMSLYGNIIYNMLGMEAYVEYLNESDKTVLKAVEILEKVNLSLRLRLLRQQPTTRNDTSWIKRNCDGTSHNKNGIIPLLKKLNGLPAYFKSWRAIHCFYRHTLFCSITHCPMRYRLTNSSSAGIHTSASYFPLSRRGTGVPVL